MGRQVFQVGAVVILDGKESTITHIAHHPAGDFVLFNNRAGIDVSKIEEVMQ